MSEAHAKLVASMETKDVSKAMSLMERDLGAFSRSASRQFAAIETQHKSVFTNIAKEQASFVRKGIGFEKLGQGTLASAALAQSIGTAATATQQLAQGAQVAGSFFGPAGMVVTGLVAVGAALKDNLNTQKEMLANAKYEAAVRDRMVDIAGRQKAVMRDELVQKETRAARLESVLGKAGAEMAGRRERLQEDIAGIAKRKDLPDAEKARMIDNLNQRAQAVGAAEFANGRRGRAEQSVFDAADPVLERARRNSLGSLGRAAEDRADRARERSLRAAAAQIADREDLKRRNTLGRETDLHERERLDRTQDLKRARQAALFQAAQRVDKGTVTKLDDDSIQKLVAAINGLIPK